MGVKRLRGFSINPREMGKEGFQNREKFADIFQGTDTLFLPKIICVTNKTRRASLNRKTRAAIIGGPNFVSQVTQKCHGKSVALCHKCCLDENVTFSYDGARETYPSLPQMN